MSLKSNIHRKLFGCDYFGWRYYCDNAVRRQRRDDKRRAKRKVRRERKRLDTEEDTV